MRTTVDLPAELMQAAKVQAAQHGEPLKELFTRALAREIATPATARADARLNLPLIGRGAEPAVDITSADIDSALASEDVERYAR